MQFRRSVTHVAGRFCYLCTRTVPCCDLTNVGADSAIKGAAAGGRLGCPKCLAVLARGRTYLKRCSTTPFVRAPESSFSPMLRFEEPHAELQESYRELVREFSEAGERLIPFPLTFPNEDFSQFLARLADARQGRDLPLGFVAHTTYWLVDGGVVVAVSNLRHELTDGLRREGGHIGYGVRPSARRRGHATRILHETLARAAARGITEVLLTCNKANIGSARTIINAGGVLVSEEFMPEREETTQRYMIRQNAATPAP